MGREDKKFFITSRGGLTLKGKLLLFVLKHRGLLKFLLKYGKIGKLYTPVWYDKNGDKHGGTEFIGIKFSWKW